GAQLVEREVVGADVDEVGPADGHSSSVARQPFGGGRSVDVYRCRQYPPRDGPRARDPARSGARHLRHARDPRAALVLGHGAGGGVEARDLVTATEVARSEGISVALIEQPYRVAGRRAPARAPQLDAAWITVVERLRER